MNNGRDVVVALFVFAFLFLGEVTLQATVVVAPPCPGEALAPFTTATVEGLNIPMYPAPNIRGVAYRATAYPRDGSVWAIRFQWGRSPW